MHMNYFFVYVGESKVMYSIFCYKFPNENLWISHHVALITHDAMKSVNPSVTGQYSLRSKIS